MATDPRPHPAGTWCGQREPRNRGRGGASAGSTCCGGTRVPRGALQSVFLHKCIKYSAQHFCCKSLPIQAHC